jgi:tetratricopeptide (TPR) repeat protein
MDFRNQTELELYFADHFDTVLFPVLADLYLRGKDLVRARKVCEIGLEYHPDQVDGLFVLANVAWEEGNLPEAEQLLKRVVESGVPHLQARKMLAAVQTELGRSQNTVAATWKKVLELEPDNETALEFVRQAEKSRKKKPRRKTKPQQKATPPPGPAAPSVPVVGESGANLSISPRLATFTLVTVLRNQGLYQQALEILDILEEKGEDPERIARERERLRELLRSGEQET